MPPKSYHLKVVTVNGIDRLVPKGNQPWKISLEPTRPSDIPHRVTWYLNEKDSQGYTFNKRPDKSFVFKHASMANYKLRVLKKLDKLFMDIRNNDRFTTSYDYSIFAFKGKDYIEHDPTLENLGWDGYSPKKKTAVKKKITKKKKAKKKNAKNKKAKKKKAKKAKKK